MQVRRLSPSSLARLPGYLEYLRSIAENGGAAGNISSAAIAQALGYGEIQVRKDLAGVSGLGRPRIGYPVAKLIAELETFLGYDSAKPAVIVGTGRLGRALLDFEGFERYGLDVIAGFDADPARQESGGMKKPVYGMEMLMQVCTQAQVRIGILAVPARQAQQAAQQMIDAGIRGILNFSPTHIYVGDDITVKNENIAVSLAELSGSINFPEA